jgi:Arc/MetJ-type ribon-helix-helix transcriptional regulator
MADLGNISVRLGPELKEHFINGLKEDDRNASQIIRDLVRKYVQDRDEKIAYEKWYCEQAEIGERQIAAGQTLSEETMFGLLDEAENKAEAAMKKSDKKKAGTR